MATDRVIVSLCADLSVWFSGALSGLTSVLAGLTPQQLLRGLAWLSVASLGLLLLGLEVVFGRAPRLASVDAPPSPSLPACPEGAWLRVVVPAYNEARNISACLAAVLASQPPGIPWELVVVDDSSSDATAELAAQALAADPEKGPRARCLLDAGPRPGDSIWRGKNWAVSRGASLPWPAGDAGGQWLLCIDADLRLAPSALRDALAEARRSEADLLSLAPRLRCACLAEWLVQPIVVILLGLGFPMARSNDPADPTAFAAGPFMLFRRSAYAAIGGHAAVADAVVEDLALARRIKGSGRRLRYLLGLDSLELQMYPDWSSLWEGWTKNWFLGLERDPVRALGSVAVVLLLFSLPWALLPLAALPGGGRLVEPALLAIGLQLLLRLWCRWRFQLPIRFWWLAAIGGLVVSAIVPASIWKTLTGRGWTWRGRALME